MYDFCQESDCKLIEFKGKANYAYLSFQYYLRMDLSKFVNTIKSVSSWGIRHEFKNHVDKIYWKNVLWNKSYFIALCGGVPVSVLGQLLKTKALPRLIPTLTLRLQSGDS